MPRTTEFISDKKLDKELIPHLFRTEYSKITAVLCKFFGADQIELAEDIASETFALALDTWPYKGVPENPAAWLYTVAKNKAKNQITRHKIFEDKVTPQVKQRESDVPPNKADPFFANPLVRLHCIVLFDSS